MATLELLLLGGREVEEAQTEDAAAIAQAHQQAAPATLDDVAGRHLAFHHGLHAALERADGGDASPVLITQRQVEEQVRHALQSQPREFLAQRGADPAQAVQRLRQRAGGKDTGAGGPGR